jgi:hypothetical protein
MGFTPFPYEISLDAANYVYTKLETESDIVNHHFDNGVPWMEALNEQPFHQNIVDDWNFRKSKTNETHKVYVSATPLNFSRNGLAAYRGESDNMELPVPWNSYPFNHVNVRTAYFNYCKRLVDFFNPDFFNMAIEANLLYVNNPTKWSEYLQLHQYVYAQLKFTYPDLKVFTSVAGAHLVAGFLEGNDYVQHRLAALQLLEHSDLYGISFYPYLGKYLANPYPEGTLEQLFSISTKPVAVAETGYAAQTFSLDAGSGLITIESDPSKQQKYIKELLTVCEKFKAVLVINFVIRDYDQLWVQIGSPTDINIAWRDSGLYDENGNPRPALNTWKGFLARKYQAPVN